MTAFRRTLRLTLVFPLVLLTLVADHRSAADQPNSSQQQSASKAEPNDQPADGPEAFVYAQKGDLPILITAPHGGRVEIAGIAPREWRESGRVNIVSDWNTDRLAEKTAADILRRTGKRPYVVIARFHRRSLDANRPEDSAYQNGEAKPYYDAYHEKIHEFAGDILEHWDQGLLVDLHGQRLMPSTIMRGTRDGKTCAPLIDRYGWKPIMGPDGLMGVLAKQGYAIFPATEGTTEGQWTHQGSYTVAEYGKVPRMNAIQLEIGIDLRRTPELADRLAVALAKALVACESNYLEHPRAATSNTAP